MTEYEARLIVGQGMPSEIILFECANDTAAVKAAELLVDNHDVELWRAAVKLGTLHPHIKTAEVAQASTNNVVSFRTK